MKAFISYSLTDQEQYIATLLSYRLREEGFSLILSNSAGNIPDATTTYQIFLSELFVGLITLDGMQWSRVMQEYELAVNNNTPAILLIEKGVAIDMTFQGNYIIFNRYNLQNAIDEVKNRMTKNAIPNKQQRTAWLLGGAAIVAFLALLAENGKK